MPPDLLTVSAQSSYPRWAALPESEKSPVSESEAPILSGPPSAVPLDPEPPQPARTRARTLTTAMASRRNIWVLRMSNLTVRTIARRGPTVASFAIDCSEACHTPTDVSTRCELGYGGHLEAAGDQLRGRPVEPRTTRDTGNVMIAASYAPDSIP